MSLDQMYSYPPTHLTFRDGEAVQKRSGGCWRGYVVGWYSTELTPEGYAVESMYEPGSVQIYPVAALEKITEDNLVDGGQIRPTNGFNHWNEK